jgi:protein-disulfide isomerase
MLGSDDALISISEFSSYQCPFCQRFHQQSYPGIKSTYIDTGIVQMYARDFPLSTQANSAPAANAAHCAGDQDAYFDYQKILYDRQSSWASQVNANTVDFVSYANELGFGRKVFTECCGSSKICNKDTN